MYDLKSHSRVHSLKVFKAKLNQVWKPIMAGLPDESKVHSFIVKIWGEATLAKPGKPAWRGHIVDVTSGERRYVKSIQEIDDYFRNILESIEIDEDSI